MKNLADKSETDNEINYKSFKMNQFNIHSDRI